MKLGSIPVPSKISVTWSRTPHSGGGWKPSGGDGACLAIAAKNCPIAPAGFHAATPIRPPGFSTRAISPAARLWSGANMQPKVETTTSKLWSSNGISWASPSTNSSSTPASPARRRASSNSSGVMSRPVTSPPATAAGIAALPVPQATSRTRSPSLTPTRETRSPPTDQMRSAIASKSPADHVARARCCASVAIFKPFRRLAECGDPMASAASASAPGSARTGRRAPRPAAEPARPRSGRTRDRRRRRAW